MIGFRSRAFPEYFFVEFENTRLPAKKVLSLSLSLSLSESLFERALDDAEDSAR
tara:strand:- start:2272 stop:2433 length:162 start_codon:yes stop_codon:yes gene_type:complete